MLSSGFRNRLLSLSKPGLVDNCLPRRKQCWRRSNSTKATNDIDSHRSIDLKDVTKDILELKWDNENRIFVKSPEDGMLDQASLEYESTPLSKKTATDKGEKLRKRSPPIELISRKANNLIDGLDRDGNGEIYMLLASLREGFVDRAKHLLWKLMKADPPPEDDVLETCLSGILARWDENDLNGFLEILDTYMENLQSDLKVAPSRCLAYILHCSCISKDLKTADKVIAEISNYWIPNYNQKMRNVLQHQDILTQYDIQRIKNVSIEIHRH